MGIEIMSYMINQSLLTYQKLKGIIL